MVTRVAREFPRTRLYSADDREQSAAKLREWLPPGSTVHTVLRNVSRSGMMRHIDVYAWIKGDNGEPIKLYLSGYVAEVCDDSRTDQGAIKVGGCGMDMGFAIVNALSYRLYPSGFDCTGDKCRGNDHFNLPGRCVCGGASQHHGEFIERAGDRWRDGAGACSDTFGDEGRPCGCLAFEQAPIPARHADGASALRHEWI